MPCPVCGDPNYNTICPKCERYVIRTLNDPVKFFEEFLILRNIMGEPQFFRPFKWQKEFLMYAKKQIQKGEPIRAVIKKGRRVGFSELMSGFMLWFVIRGVLYDGEDKYWDVISASFSQSKRLIRSARRMATRNPLIKSTIKTEKNGWLKASDYKIEFGDSRNTIEAILTALSSGGATKRGRSPSGQTFDEAAQIPDSDFNDLDISSMAADDHQIIGSTPYDDKGFFYDLIKKKPNDYKFFIVPTAEITQEGKTYLMNGELKKITSDHITEVRGYKITKDKIIQRLQKYDYVTAAREIFGEFISSSKLYYPPSLVNRFHVFTEDSVFYDIEFSEIHEKLKEYSPDRVLVGVDWAGKGNDKTALVIFAEKNGMYDMIYFDSWSRMKYTNQYKEIADIVKSIWSEAEVYVDYTGTQDAQYDGLEEYGLNVKPVLFSSPNKKRMAEIMYNLIVSEKLRILMDEEIFTEVIEVKNNLRGRNDHLGDYVASIWCALSSVNPFVDNDSEGDVISLGGQLESVSIIDDDLMMDKILPEF